MNWHEFMWGALAGSVYATTVIFGLLWWLEGRSGAAGADLRAEQGESEGL